MCVTWCTWISGRDPVLFTWHWKDAFPPSVMVVFWGWWLENWGLFFARSVTRKREKVNQWRRYKDRERELKAVFAKVALGICSELMYIWEGEWGRKGWAYRTGKWEDREMRFVLSLVRGGKRKCSSNHDEWVSKRRMIKRRSEWNGKESEGRKDTERKGVNNGIERTNDIKNETSRSISKGIHDETGIISWILQFEIINHQSPPSFSWLFTTCLDHVMIMEPIYCWFGFPAWFALQSDWWSNFSLDHFITGRWHLNYSRPHYNVIIVRRTRIISVIIYSFRW